MNGSRGMGRAARYWRQLVLALVITTGVVFAAAAGSATAGDGVKIAPVKEGNWTICHRPPGNDNSEHPPDWIVLNNMPENAWNGHDGHEGDQLIHEPDATAEDCEERRRNNDDDGNDGDNSGPEPEVVIAAPPATEAVQQVAASRRVCTSRRRFRIRVRTTKGDPVVTAVIYVNNKKVRTLRGARVGALVVLQGLTKGRYEVRIIATTKSGKKKTGTRRYLTCTPRPARLTVPRL